MFKKDNEGNKGGYCSESIRLFKGELYDIKVHIRVLDKHVSYDIGRIKYWIALKSIMKSRRV